METPITPKPATAQTVASSDLVRRSDVVAFLQRRATKLFQMAEYYGQPGICGTSRLTAQCTESNAWLVKELAKEIKTRKLSQNTQATDSARFSGNTLASILMRHGIIAPRAVEDAQGYDGGMTMLRIRTAAQEISEALAPNNVK